MQRVAARNSYIPMVCVYDDDARALKDRAKESCLSLADYVRESHGFELEHPPRKAVATKRKDTRL
jgi:hypothetical protein